MFFYMLSHIITRYYVLIYSSPKNFERLPYQYEVLDNCNWNGHNSHLTYSF